MEITNDTSTTVGPYQLSYGLQNARNVASSPSQNTQPTDGVQLSEAATVAAMHTFGMTINQIAANSGLTTAEVDSYLDITTTTAAAGGGGGGAPVGGGQAPAKSSDQSQSASGSQSNGTSQTTSTSNQSSETSRTAASSAATQTKKAAA